MRERSLSFLVIVVILAVARCSPSPAGLDVAPVGESHTLRPAIDCDSAEDIRARINTLETDGTLNSGRATALRSKLDQAERWQAEGRDDRAAGAYERLIGQVQAWVDEGTLSEEDMADLLACAEDVLDGPDLTLAVISETGGDHTCGLTTGADAFCWGRNLEGQLGDGNAGTSSDTPVAVVGGLIFEAISAGLDHTCGVTGGNAYCWGKNNFGQLGDGNAGVNSGIPVAVDGGLTFQSISAGGEHTCGMTTGGNTYCWGRNLEGQLGDGNAGTNSDTPIAVVGAPTFQLISSGILHTCGVTTGDNAYCWGLNLNGQLGNGNAGTNSEIPVAVVGGHTFKSISAGSRDTCGVTTSGNGYCWGSNLEGQLGDGNVGTSSDTPVAVVGGLVFETISMGSRHACGVTNGGNAYCWGRNFEGQLGDGNEGTSSDIPVAVVGGRTFQSISAGIAHTCGVTPDGDAYCWGVNGHGQLGDGSIGTNSDTPVPVVSP